MRSISSIWEFVRNTNSQDLRLTELETLRVGARELCFKQAFPESQFQVKCVSIFPASFLLNKAIKPEQKVYSSYLRILKSEQTEEEGNLN